MKSDHGWIRTLLDEAENERMHLMTFIHIAKPSRLERLLVLLAQGTFYNFYFLLYLISARTAHRVMGYLEEEAVCSYTEYLAGVDEGIAVEPTRATAWLSQLTDRFSALVSPKDRFGEHCSNTRFC